MRRLIVLLLLVGTLLPQAALRAVSAASETGDISVYTADVLTGKPITDVCYVIETASEEGCDENGDGKVDFKGVVPGLYTLTQTKTPKGYLPVGDHPIAVQAGPGQAAAVFQTAATRGGGTFDIAIQAVDSFNGKVQTGACFLLYGGSLEGCDENNDGKVTFQGVKAGTYLAVETSTPKGYLIPDPFWIEVSAKEPKLLKIWNDEDGTGNGLPNVSIYSVDADTGDSLTGACFVIQGGSEEGCDENNDGHVEFRGVADGVYTVTETRAPSGYDAVDDFTIVVAPVGQTDFTAQHTATNGGGGSPQLEYVDVSIVSRDAQTGDRLVGACYIIEDYSNEGCDENNDGQVDFKDIPTGRYAVTETRAPEGYRLRVNLQFLFSTPANGGRDYVYVDHERK